MTEPPQTPPTPDELADAARAIATYNGRRLSPAARRPPDVTGLNRSAILHPDGRLYLERYDLIADPNLTVRLHHWHASDDHRAPHDHPWPSVSTVLAGALIEHTAAGPIELTPGTVVTRTATDPHRIELVTADAWTLFVTGRAERRWGYHTATGWIHWADYPYAGRYETDPPAPLTSSRHW